jgi:hypothetical protein
MNVSPPFSQFTRAQNLIDLSGASIQAVQTYPRFCIIKLASKLYYRRIWPYFYSSSGTGFEFQIDLVASLDSVEQFRMTIIHETIPAIADRFRFGIVQTSTQLSSGPSLLVYINTGSTPETLPPFDIAIACDSMWLEASKFIGGTGSFSAGLYCLSQAILT